MPTFKRIIPLYAFVTGEFAWLETSRHFYFLPVTLMSILKPYTIYTNYTLAMMYGQATSSTMRRIINATGILVDTRMDWIAYAKNNITGVFEYFSMDVYL